MLEGDDWYVFYDRYNDGPYMGDDIPDGSISFKVGCLV
jgi:hypothetical protein